MPPRNLNGFDNRVDSTIPSGIMMPPPWGPTPLYEPGKWKPRTHPHLITANAALAALRTTPHIHWAVLRLHPDAIEGTWGSHAAFDAEWMSIICGGRDVDRVKINHLYPIWKQRIAWFNALPQDLPTPLVDYVGLQIAPWVNPRWALEDFLLPHASVNTGRVLCRDGVLPLKPGERLVALSAATDTRPYAAPGSPHPWRPSEASQGRLDTLRAACEAEKATVARRRLEERRAIERARKRVERARKAAAKPSPPLPRPRRYNPPNRSINRRPGSDLGIAGAFYSAAMVQARRMADFREWDSMSVPDLRRLAKKLRAEGQLAQASQANQLVAAKTRRPRKGVKPLKPADYQPTGYRWDKGLAIDKRQHRDRAIQALQLLTIPMHQENMALEGRTTPNEEEQFSLSLLARLLAERGAEATAQQEALAKAMQPVGVTAPIADPDHVPADLEELFS